ncbi:MAG: hypothetical protein AAGE99_00745 [Chlamydiota bacterium]
MIRSYIPEDDTVYLIEIYSKSDKKDEDRARIERFMRGLLAPS